MAEELMNPRGIWRYEEKNIAARMGDLNGKVLGLLDNSKQNADLFLDQVLGILGKEISFGEVLRIKKPAGSVPASFPPGFLERCQVVINAFGD
jgi:hypothetical protein